MAETVLDNVATWFEINVFSLFRESTDSDAAIKKTFAAVDHYL